MLDTRFLVATILVVIAVLFYTLYWSRFIAFLISLLFRVVFWNRGSSSVWIQIGTSTPASLPVSCTLLTLVLGSFHISPLAGRILLKDVHYHSSNQTFKIVKVELRWQYWVRSLARSDDLQAQGGGEEPKCTPTLISFLSSVSITTQFQLAIRLNYHTADFTRRWKALNGLSTIGRLPLII
jgi:hypothetical protein